ncbi:phosphatidylinositol-specific phospholipase C domain-containing protein [Streptomyces sp. NPDC057702]|uniref:phosphatidylinositol-specific phospholipase C domain-containing protein n=1 Tax=unclassified Streptomyces TaxID=2593676 RepID=UPI0036AB039D
MDRATRRSAVTLAALAALVVAGSTADAGQRTTAPAYSATTSVGVHNAYEKSVFPHLADALDSGAALLELDVWTNAFGPGWRVSHGNPLGNDNNCAGASTVADLRARRGDRDLPGCLADLRTWHEAHPGHRPVLVKVELKDGFNDKHGRGPQAFDTLLDRTLGDALFRPGELAVGHATLDAAVRARGWPTRDALAGRFVVELIPGTVEEKNPLDTLWTDREYALHLRDLAARDELDRATAFPAVHGAAAGDPRERYRDASIRAWFVLFDGDASQYANGSVDTAWYDRRHYLLVMTDAHRVPPAIDGTRPTEEQARTRVGELAARHASFATADWYPLPRVLSLVLPRG